MTSTSRIAGYDVARALAVIGMVIVNYDVLLTGGITEGPPEPFENFTRSLQGRASALFVVLAGVGLSLMTQRAREEGGEALASTRIRIMKRAVFFFVAGLGLMPLWPGDILHYYGVYFAIGALIFAARAPVLGGIAVIAPVVFVGMQSTLDYEAGWIGSELRYEGFWTLTGSTRNTFFNGFHPVFPWITFFVVGIGLGRRRLDSTAVRYLAFLGIAGMMLLDVWQEYGVSRVLERWEQSPDSSLALLLATKPMPPVPLYVLKGVFGAFGVIGTSLILVERVSEERLRPLVAMGQLALTVYIAHVVVGLAAFELLDLYDRADSRIALSAALAFSALALMFATAWRRRFERGPVEALMRRLTG